MKKARPQDDELRAEYTAADFKKLERGKYFERVTAQSNVVVIDPDVAAMFPNSESVNRALHTLADAARRVARAPKPRTTPKRSRG